MAYRRFAAMIATSTVVMFLLMYLNTYAFEHVFWSETRMWMALLMGATMAIIMLSFMLSMYEKKALNIAIFAGSAIVFALALWLVRSQATIDDREYMSAMIPHHSIAIMTSERAQISDPRVRKLADEIILAQRREIAEMRYLIEAKEAQVVEMAPEPAPEIVPASVAVSRSAVPTIDPGALDEAEIAKVLPPGPRCAFSYTAAGHPVLAAAPLPDGAHTRAVVKINGRLVVLEAEAGNIEALQRRTVFAADGMRLTVTPRRENGEGERSSGLGRWNTDMLFELDEGLSAGYGGWYRCGGD